MNWYKQSHNSIQKKLTSESLLGVSYPTLIMDHGEPREKVIVLFHGYTSSPKQFEELGISFFRLGFNVYIPRMPWHGLEDELNIEISQLDPNHLKAHAQNSLRIAQGLGDKITVLGLSGGAVIAAWLGFQQNSIKQILLVSPALGVHPIPSTLYKSAPTLLRRLPNFFLWWNEQHKKDIAHCYPRMSTHGLSAFLKLASEIFESPPPSEGNKSFSLITNAADQKVDNAIALKIWNRWKNQSNLSFKHYEFMKSFALPHDLIDPQSIQFEKERVYRQIFKMLNISL